MDAATHPPLPANEPIRSYGPGTADRARLEAALASLRMTELDLTCTIGGIERQGAGPELLPVSPPE